MIDPVLGLLFVVSALVLLDVLALRFGADSRGTEPWRILG